MLLPVYWLSPASPITAENLPLILFAGIFSSIVASFFWMQGVAHLGANRAMLFMNLLPVLVALIAVAVLNEALHSFHLIGGLVTLSGVLLVELPKLRRTERNTPQSKTN
jgi:drug/metabolite transporter (DMT)-like permease